MGISPETTVWVAFNIAAGHILLVILLATSLTFRSARQPIPVVSSCFTWIFSGIVSCLLFYKGEQVGAEPGKSLCQAQAILITPMPVLTSMAALALVYDTWSTFTPAQLREGLKDPATHKLTSLLLVVIPYITYIAFMSVGIPFALNNPGETTRSGKNFYCSMDWAPNNNAVAFTAGIVSLSAVALQGNLNKSHGPHSLADCRPSEIDLHLIFRIALFTLYTAASAALHLVTVANVDIGVAPDMLAASGGLMFFFVFATRREILRVWSSLIRRRLPRSHLRDTRNGRNTIISASSIYSTDTHKIPGTPLTPLTPPAPLSPLTPFATPTSFAGPPTPSSRPKISAPMPVIKRPSEAFERDDDDDDDDAAPAWKTDVEAAVEALGTSPEE
ncbi:uncharacterized protein BXZ73DRAFT_104061 [Epithele typhae]|uniref:uncharacterized protein n=1 Tax=Epithele typhae TaxID=378194 RepID=UPI002007E6C0|nr:uncharacterized protein BXZ73DRAFT_104061 [Epithele typhae]KAH9922828.1 hypothetical protein BXZ73DRAFT_104061 [Epithele typhae]